MTRVAANAIAENVWIKFLAKMAMIVFGLLGTVGVPAAVIYLRETSRTLIGIDKGVAQLRADWRAEQARDDGRFALLAEKIADHERRIRQIEATRVDNGTQ